MKEEKPDRVATMIDANEGIFDGRKGKPYNLDGRSRSQRKIYLSFYQIGVSFCAGCDSDAEVCYGCKRIKEEEKET